jgi:endonuclease YncB( thermonuclease family)
MSARRAAVVVSIALAGAAIGLPPALALGHEGKSHQAEDSAPHAAADEARLGSFTSRATARDATNAAAAVTGTEGDVGQWGPVVDWPVVGVHVALLPNGKVLAYDSIGDHATESYPVQDHTRATVWDPATGTQTPVNVDTGFNVFCSGLAHLTDGSIFLAGGNKDQQLNGIVQTHTFNPTTNTWSLGPNMVAGRWYPSVTPLRDGEMLITEGGPDMPEVRTTAGGLRALNTASLNLPLYPWIDVAPDGRAFYSGPDQTMRSLNTTGGGAWQAFGQRDTLDRSYGSHALYDIGKILVAGGGASSADARVIDINGATPQVSATAPMAHGRRQHNLTVLADGTVLATGGNSSGASLVDLNSGVYPAEQWNPATRQWKTLAAMQVTRQYHSTALLLPNGRVLSAGGGICDTCDTVQYLAKNAEVFTPPYLFKNDGSGELAPRPTIAAAPNQAAYATHISISTPDAASIRKVALVRLGAVTHSVNMEQRYVPLSFTSASGTLTATAPRDANVAPPGMYMLFAIDANGVPSTARMLTVTEHTTPTPVTVTQPASGTQPTTASPAAPSPLSAAPKARRYSGRVVRVVDGDTVRVRLSSGKVRGVRLIGIDAPERKRPGTSAECGSGRAASALRRLLMQRRGGRLGGRRVRLTTDPTQGRSDRHGRLLAYVSRGSLDVNRQMVRRGWARAYVSNGKPARRIRSYTTAQESAKLARRGVWRTCGGDFHRSTGG